MQKEHGQVTGIIWCGPEDLAVYQLVKQYAEKPEVISNQYIHNLYRFFKLYPRRRELHDIFKDSLSSRPF